MSEDMYQVVTDRIIAELDRGTVPWRKPWNTEAGQPRSIDGKPYRGINTILLGLSSYGDPRWGTYDAIKRHGGQVRRGERSEQVVLWKPTNSKPDADGERHQYLLLRYFRVFNVEQADWPEPLDESVPLDESASAESVLSGYMDGPSLSYGGGSAYYRVSTDHVQMPPRESFSSESRFYTTLFHELTHSTGHASRLNREEITERNGFGSLPYSREELVAEIGACMLAAITGIDPDYQQSAAYIESWRAALSRDHKLIISAAARAQKAVDHIIGRSTT